MKRLVIAALALVAVFTVAGSALAAATASRPRSTTAQSERPDRNRTCPATAWRRPRPPRSAARSTSRSRVPPSGSSPAPPSRSAVGRAGRSLGQHQSGSCVTPAGATYSLPITLNIYDGRIRAVTSKTQTFAVAYRPSANPAKCGPLDPNDPPDEVVLDDRQDVLQRSGAGRDVHLRRHQDPSRHVPATGSPTGPAITGPPRWVPRTCTSTVAGCFYDSLNVAEVPIAERRHRHGHAVLQRRWRHY